LFSEGVKNPKYAAGDWWILEEGFPRRGHPQESICAQQIKEIVLLTVLLRRMKKSPLPGVYIYTPGFANSLIVKYSQS